MKAIAKQTTYFSAYPLKVLEQAAASAPETPQSPYLKALLTRKSATVARIRVTPMVNPYKVQVNALPLRPAPLKQQDPEGREWFNHYE